MLFVESAAGFIVCRGVIGIGLATFVTSQVSGSSSAYVCIPPRKYVCAYGWSVACFRGGPFLCRASGGLSSGCNDYHRAAPARHGRIYLTPASLARLLHARKPPRASPCYTLNIRPQVWCTQMYSKSVVGLVNATAAGWGNMGGGVTNLVMPFVFSAIYNLLDGTPARPTRKTKGSPSLSSAHVSADYHPFQARLSTRRTGRGATATSCRWRCASRPALPRSPAATCQMARRDAAPTPTSFSNPNLILHPS